MKRPLAAVVAVVAVLGLASCRTSDLAFRVDERVEIESPASRQVVSLPLTLRWKVNDAKLRAMIGTGRDQGAFVVFVDREPIRPGQSIASLAENRTCRDTGDCPTATADWLAERYVFRTTDTELTLNQLLDLGSEGGAREAHEATIVLVDASGRRVGESVFFVRFYVDRAIR